MHALLFWVMAALLVAGVSICLRRDRLFALFLPLAGLLLYLMLGTPQLPDFPLQSRLNQPIEELPAGAIIVLLEERLRQTPEDVKGRRLLARAQASVGQIEAASANWLRVLETAGEDAEAYRALALSRIEGEVIPDTSFEFLKKAYKLAPEDIMTRYYLGLAYAQQADIDKAREIWVSLLADVPAGLPVTNKIKALMAEFSNQPSSRHKVKEGVNEF